MTQQRHAVLVGNSLYPEEDKLGDLNCPERDVDGLAELLRSPKYGAFTNTVVLKDRPHHEVLLQINRTLKGAAKGDLVFLYYSGHGKLDLANRLHLCTVNTVIDTLEATSVPVQSIKNYIDVSPPRQVTLVLDCCFSGAVGNVFARSGVDDQLQLMSGGRGTYIMSASTGIQVALEKEEDQYSIFTKRIIEGIETGAADVNGDGIVTMDELYNYVHDRVLDDGFQEPMKWGINVRGELVIAKTGRSPKAERRKQIRQRLLELASSGVLPDRILSQAMQLLSSGETEVSPEMRSRSELLDKVTDEDLAVGEFVERWLTLDFQSRRRSSGAPRASATRSAPAAREPPPSAPSRRPPEPSPPSAPRKQAPQPPPEPNAATATGFDKVWWPIGGITAVVAIAFRANPDSLGVVIFGLIPLATLALAFLRPVFWAYAALYAGALQGLAFLGYSVGGYEFSGSDGALVAFIIAANAGLCATVTGLRMRHRKAAIRARSTGQVLGRTLAVNLFRALVYGVLTWLSLWILSRMVSF